MLAATLTFADPVFFDVDTNPESVLVADLNADGHADLVSANYAPDNVSVLLGKGDGTFHPQQRYGTGIGPIHTVAADLDGDRVLDLASEIILAESPA